MGLGTLTSKWVIVKPLFNAGSVKKSCPMTEQPIDTSTAAGKCFLDMLGVFAEFETNLRRERQLEGFRRRKQLVSTRGASRVSRLARSRH
jgi:DNA invertase Pin-like site-specific DNA recombinase